MVVNRKQNLTGAPNMVNSRSNSTQSLPRTKPTSNSKSISTAGPSISTLKKSKHKKSPKASKSSKSSSIVDRLIVYLLALSSIYALWICPSDTHLSNPLCRSLSQYRTHVLDPYVIPPIQQALSHPSIAPAVAHLQSVERVVTPVILRTHAAAQPYISKATHVIQATAAIAYGRVFVPVYNRHIQPSFQRYIYPQYAKYVLPRVQLVQSRIIDPYLGPLTFQAHFYTHKALHAIRRLYVAIAPRVQLAYVQARPHIQRLWETLRPHVLKAVESGTAALGLAWEKFGESRRQLVDPHVIRIWAKVVELSGSSATPSAFAATVSETVWSSTASVSDASTLSASVSETKATSSEAKSETPAPITPVVESVAASTSSTVVAVITASISEAAIPEEPALPVETLVSEEILVEPVAETTTPSPLATENPASEIVDSETYDDAEVVPEMEAKVEVEVPAQDEDLDDFFAELGIEEDEPVEADNDILYNDDDEVDETTTSLTPEESAEAQKIATAKKRAELERRLEKWQLDLNDLIKRRTKAFRKELVRVRKGAVRSLFPDPEKDNGDLENTLTHIRGEDVAGILGRFEKDSEKLLRGLESYLKKEEKAVGDASAIDFDDRMRRWYNVVGKVEERFKERLSELQEKVHWWYLEVRELEVQEYHRATAEIKVFAQKAQGEMGMPMAWLDDITYNDWQKYHDLMRSHEKFDEQIRIIQNGTHPSPPIDPLVPALDKLQMDLGDIQNGFNSRIRALGLQIHDILAPRPAEQKRTGDVPVTEEDESEQVSILPLDPSSTAPADQQDFDASNIIIGKSKEQMEEALSIAQEPVHEEL
ncbi:hypothetical protein D9757_007510 [Collybiopsis confluens]|uniref:Uncharacterized protein n=1 Tax=Collybiopsis confluens TaxID=2823264 RepID=A0A8H5M8H6_9AGAR|nr:hypothetical protein D9757_007510 [Collybiopsis confluens]